MSDAPDKPRAPGQPALRELVDYLARGLVDHPEEVEVEEVSEPDALVFELKVAEQDLGKVIGKQGRNAKALRTILSAASTPSTKSGTSAKRRSRPSVPTRVATSWAPFQNVPSTRPSDRPASSSTAKPTTSST